MVSRARVLAFLLLPLLAVAAVSGAGRVARAGDGSVLIGAWDCEEDGARSKLEFLSSTRLRYDDETAVYELTDGAILVQEDYGPVPYYYRLQQDTLIILSLDGSVTRCRKSARAQDSRDANAPGASVAGTGSGLVPGPNWPPYERPAEVIDEDSSDPQALLFKFAGRWDRVSSNTLTNLYLKPDGTYEEHYEAGYSGEFRDEGGYQTGAWGVAGSERGRGRWMMQGTLKRGILTLIDSQGNRAVYDYEVHVRDGETFWGEYLFNGQLYSVSYVYR